MLVAFQPSALRSRSVAPGTQPASVHCARHTCFACCCQHLKGNIVSTCYRNNAQTVADDRFEVRPLGKPQRECAVLRTPARTANCRSAACNVSNRRTGPCHGRTGAAGGIQRQVGTPLLQATQATSGLTEYSSMCIAYSTCVLRHLPGTWTGLWP
jgi:hypothetical protein